MTDPAALPNFPPPADEHPLRGRILDALIDQGIQPRIDDDGDVAFTVNEQQLFVRVSEGDLKILRVFGQWQLPDELKADEARAMVTCNELNLILNCVKTCIGVGNGTLIVTVDHMETPGLDLAMAMQISIQLVLQTVHVWHQRALGITPENAPGPDGGQPS